MDLALEACNKLFSKNWDARSQIDGIIFCTQTPDYVSPPNSCLLQSMLGLSEDVFALDFTLACSGYVYGLGLAQGLILSGMTRNILLVTSDTYSRFSHKQDRSVRPLFGDGAAVSWITSSDSTQGIVDIRCCTSGDTETIVIPAGGCRIPKSKETAEPRTDVSGNVRTLEHFDMDGMGVRAFVSSKVLEQIRGLLSANNLATDDVDMFVLHQASKVVLDRAARSLGVEQARMYQNLREVGNTVSASIPIALRDALDDDKISRGDAVLLSGFGVGLSWASALIEI